MLLFLTTNMAAVTSRANQQYDRSYYDLLVGGVSFKRLKTAQNPRTRHSKNTVSYVDSFLLHYINIWDQKVQNSVVYEAFLPITCPQSLTHPRLRVVPIFPQGW